MADLDQLLCEIPRGDSAVRIARRTYNGSRPFVDVRVFVVDERTGEPRPTTKGIALREHEIGDVVRVLGGLLRERNAAKRPPPPEPIRPVPLPPPDEAAARVAEDSRIF